MKKLLIAYDGSDSSREAVFDLRRAALPADCHALILSVADVQIPSALVAGGPPFPDEFSFALQNAYEEGKSSLKFAQSTAEHGAEFTKKLFPRWKVDIQSHADSPSQALINQSVVWKPDLLVVGSHSHTPWGRFLFGSVSMSVLNAVPCSVRIGRGRIEENIAPARLVVGLDGSPSSLHAIETLLERSWPKGSAVHFVTVVDARLITSVIDPNGPIRRWLKTDDPEPLAWVSRMQQHYEQKAQAAGLIASSFQRQDDPKDFLLDEAAKWGADCIFVGSRGLGLGGRLVLGSVSTAVASRARCSVEVVKGA